MFQRQRPKRSNDFRSRVRATHFFWLGVLINFQSTQRCFNVNMMSRTNNSAQNDVYPKYQNNFLIIQDVITKTYQEIKNSIQFSNFEKKLGIFSKLKLKSLT